MVSKHVCVGKNSVEICVKNITLNNSHIARVYKKIVKKYIIFMNMRIYELYNEQVEFVLF
jgi:hypothetical protein